MEYFVDLRTRSLITWGQLVPSVLFSCILDFTAECENIKNIHYSSEDNVKKQQFLLLQTFKDFMIKKKQLGVHLKKAVMYVFSPLNWIVLCVCVSSMLHFRVQWYGNKSNYNNYSCMCMCVRQNMRPCIDWLVYEPVSYCFMLFVYARILYQIYYLPLIR